MRRVKREIFMDERVLLAGYVAAKHLILYATLQTLARLYQPSTL